jgi:hypothetical protein
MVNNKSLDPYKQIFIAALRDVQTFHATVFSPRALRLTIQKVEKRCEREGLGFLTKTLPRLAKASDRALTGEVPFDGTLLRFATRYDSKLPIFLGELFERIFAHDGWILPTPCVDCIKSVRQLLLVLYKLELEYDTDQEQKIVDQFVRSVNVLRSWNECFREIREHLEAGSPLRDEFRHLVPTVRLARITLNRVFRGFDPHDIHPSHGPGAVSTGEQLSRKYVWSSVSPRLIAEYPLDAYFYASLGHVCDEYKSGFDQIALREESAKVLLVPKDSRGPRLISCEPLTFQWIQQGLGRAIVQRAESHPLTRWSVRFTDQRPNQLGALMGSIHGGYATLDLKEASDRIPVELVRLLFPEHLSRCLLAARSLSTRLPDGSTLELQKFAPMGSALCFPILALTIWSVLHAGFFDASVNMSHRTVRKYLQSGANEDIYVYGDDVIVPTAKAANAVTLLESFGLLCNRDKSCVSGFFRESCGMDAYKGQSVTPVRIRTPWRHSQHPDSFLSYLAYAKSFWKLGYRYCYDEIVGLLTKIYRDIPEDGTTRSVFSLPCVPESARPRKVRINHGLQLREYLVTVPITPRLYQRLNGWSMLLRYFAEAGNQSPVATCNPSLDGPTQMHWASMNAQLFEPLHAFSVSSYARRKTSKLVKRWR